MHRIFLYLVFLIASFGAVACQNPDSAETNTLLQVTQSIPTVAPSIVKVPDTNQSPASTPAAPASAQFNLNIWIDSPILIEEGQPGAAVFTQQVAAYDTANPTLSFDIQVKQIAGSGGMLDYLRTGRGVADQVLPDVILLPVELLPIAVADQLIYPLDDYLDSSKLYAAPAALSTIDNKLYGYPFIATELHHFAYASAVLENGVPPLRWDDLVSNKQLRIILAADTPNITNLLLEQYLANGRNAGTVIIEEPAFNFQVGPLTKALGRFASGRNSNVILPLSAETPNSLAALDTLRQGIANGALVDATDYLTQLASPEVFRFGPIPGGDSAAHSLVSSWVWAITTPDPVEQQLSAEFISFITAPENLGAWTTDAHLLPANPNAFDYWPQNSYTSFLRGQLVNAIPYPLTIDGDDILILQQATTDIIENGGDVTAIAEQIIADLEQ